MSKNYGHYDSDENERLRRNSKTTHVKTVTHFLHVEIGYASDLGPAGLYEAIIEAIEKAGVLAEANIIYIRARAPEFGKEAVDLWIPEPPDTTPPPIPPTCPHGEDGLICDISCRCECHEQQHPNI